MLVHDVGTYREHTMTTSTPSIALWYASRATGVVSLLLLSLVVMLGILVNRQGRLPGLPSFAVTGLHRSLSLLSVLFIAVHVATAVIDPFVSIGLAAAVIPFVSPYEPFWLGLGAVALDHGYGVSPDLRSGGLWLLTIGCALAVGAAGLWRLAGTAREVPRAERAV